MHVPRRQVLTVAALAGVVSVLLLAGRPSVAGAVTQQAKPAPAGLTVTARSLHRGDLVSLAGGGFAPLARLVISFRSAPVVVAAAVADAQGRFALTVAVPAGASRGQHRFEASGPRLGGGDLVVSAAVRIVAPARGGSWVVPLVMVVLTLIIASTAWVAWAMLSRHQDPVLRR